MSSNESSASTSALEDIMARLAQMEVQWNGITKKLINHEIKSQMSSIDHSCHLSSSLQLKRHTNNSLINECRVVETTPD
ncbi:hypothetical protein [Parasitella parasitica]|uniref:Uncharacterized protein n=1 Tax=Parasitella parasitica TaxID=35722 RepID=A0A0B7NGN8_9FUNG|nr:hypothetical protein [Parasitella parasitica]